jgi:hypothetical protein
MCHCWRPAQGATRSTSHLPGNIHKSIASLSKDFAQSFVKMAKPHAMAVLALLMAAALLLTATSPAQAVSYKQRNRLNSCFLSHA